MAKIAQILYNKSETIRKVYKIRQKTNSFDSQIQSKSIIFEKVYFFVWSIFSIKYAVEEYYIQFFN